MSGGVERKRMSDAGHPEEGWDEASPWYQWGPYLSIGRGARCARTTAPTATPGTRSRTITPDPALLDSLAPFMAGRTTIIISHRPSVAARTDRQVVLGD